MTDREQRQDRFRKEMAAVIARTRSTIAEMEDVAAEFIGLLAAPGFRERVAEALQLPGRPSEQAMLRRIGELVAPASQSPKP